MNKEIIKFKCISNCPECYPNNCIITEEQLRERKEKYNGESCPVGNISKWEIIKKECQTCNLIKQIQENISLYKKDYKDLGIYEELECKLIKVNYKFNKIVGSMGYQKGKLNYCPECGVNIND